MESKLSQRSKYGEEATANIPNLPEIKEIISSGYVGPYFPFIVKKADTRKTEFRMVRISNDREN